ncbi:MAG: CoA-binding protein [Actinomycetota bacterium]
MTSIETLLNDGDPVVAVIGATDTPWKYGAKIYRDLKAKGFRVYPVNPTSSTVDGDRSYATLGELPETADIVNFVIPPTRTMSVLERTRDVAFGVVWLQPGAGDAAVVSYLVESGMSHVVDDCIMVRARPRVGRR